MQLRSKSLKLPRKVPCGLFGRCPEQVTPNLYGNLVANVVAGLTGGPGILPGVNVGDHCAVFEQARRCARPLHVPKESCL